MKAKMTEKMSGGVLITWPDLDEEVSQKIRDLEFKINTTPKWMGRFIYERMLRKLCNSIKIKNHAKTRLNLCYDHAQEPNHSHFSPHNCDHCKVLIELKMAKQQQERG